MLNLGKVKPGSTLYVPFDTFAGSTGASITASGLAVSDIEIYKNGSTTQRSSDTGYSLLDTDGLDLDGVTGIHGFSIDLSSNADSGFFVAGASYRVVVSTITVDGQTLSFTAAVFEIGYEGAILDTTIASLTAQSLFTLTAGPAEDDALNGCLVLIHDIASAVQTGFAVIQDYTGLTKTVQLENITTFTVAAGDNISIFPPIKLPQTLPIPANVVQIISNTSAPALLASWAGSLISDTVMGAGANYVDVATASGDLLGWLVYDVDNVGARLIVAWDDGLKRATVTPDWVTQPTGDVLFIPGGAAILTAAGLQTDAVTEIQTGLSTLDAAGVRTAVGLASANLDTQLSNILTRAIILSGTLANADTTSIDLGALTFGDDELNNLLIRVYDNSTGEYHSRWIDDYTGATSIATLSAALPFTTESGIDTFVVYAIRRDVTASIGAADIRSAVGLASANLDTQLSGINAKTTNLPSDPADASDIAASFSTVNSTLSTIAEYIDTEVAAIKAKTDNLPTDPADASDIAASFSAVNVLLSTIEGAVDPGIATLLTRIPDTLSLANINAQLVDVVGTDVIPDSVAADGVRPTMFQALLMITRFLMEKEVVGTTVTVNKEDGTTASMTFTLDSATTPTSITRAT